MPKKYTLRIRNNAFRNNNLDDMGICIITKDKKILMDEIEHALDLGNIDLAVEVDEEEEKANAQTLF